MSVIVAEVVVSTCLGLSCGKDREVMEQLGAKYLCILLLGHLLARKENQKSDNKKEEEEDRGLAVKTKSPSLCLEGQSGYAIKVTKTFHCTA